MKPLKKIMSLLLMMMIVVISRIDIVNAKNNEDYDNGPNIEIKNITKTQEETLFKLCKIWGFAKYYHPQVASGKIDWDSELFKIMPKLLNEKEQKQVDKFIYQWINGLGEVEAGEDINHGFTVKISANTGWIKDTKFISEDLSKLLIKINNCKRTGMNYYVNVPEDELRAVFTNEKAYEKMSYLDDGCKLLSLFRYWNIIEYYCPNRHIMDENWDLVLKEFIPKIVNEDSELQYKLNLRELMGKVQDGHAYINNDGPIMKEFNGTKSTPFSFDYVEGKVVVNKVLKDVPNLNVKVGDIILKKDGRNIEDIIKEKAKYYQPLNANYVGYKVKVYLGMTNNDYANFTIERDNNIFEEMVFCSREYLVVTRDDEDKPSHLIKDNILYINPGYLEADEIYGIMDKSMNTKGLILDLRSYPSDEIIDKLDKYLFDKPVEFAKFSYVNKYKPGEFIFSDTEKIGKENPNYYKGKVVILIDENSISQSEYATMAFRKAPNSIVVGSNSCGADGSVTSFLLPGGMKTCISGVGVYYPDGTETQKIGIVPDVRVVRTIKGIKEGRDELIEKAIEIINQ